MLLLLWAMVGVMLTGCDRGLGAGIGVDNKTDLELKFELFLDGRWYRPPARAHPGQTALVLGSSSAALSPEGCTTGVLVARTEDGREVARHDPPLCIDDVWTIENADVGGSSGSPDSSP